MMEWGGLYTALLNDNSPQITRDYDFLILMAWSGRVGVGGVGVKVSPDLLVRVKIILPINFTFC